MFFDSCRVLTFLFHKKEFPLAGMIDRRFSRRALKEIEASLADTVVIHLDLYIGEERENPGQGVF